MAPVNVTVSAIKSMKLENRKIAAVTAWDFPSGRLADEAGIDLVLVGDSLAMTIRGDQNTLEITTDEMIYHSRLVARACRGPLVIADMPFMSYQVSPEQALENAGRFMKEAGVHGVKIEGGGPMVATTERLVAAGIPVLGHIGLTPQSIHLLGGYAAQGKTVDQAEALERSAVELEAAGVFALVLECVPDLLAKRITGRAAIPTIGIGAGPDCDGQIQVTADLLGLGDTAAPRHAKAFADLHSVGLAAMRGFKQEVVDGEFPTDKESIPAPEELVEFFGKESD